MEPRISTGDAASIDHKASALPEVPQPDLTFYFEGRAIYGDDFTPEQIEAWFDGEREGYANLGAKDRDKYVYGYHALNRVHGYRSLPKSRRFNHVLGFGSAYGDELLPVLDRVDRVTIVDPSDSFVGGSELGGKPAAWVKPDPSGTLPFADSTFDLITCFGVLHHIPNVSKALAEFRRVLTPDGILLIREPITSMGDWRRPRPGLTANERGLPLAPLHQAIANAGLRERSFRLTGFGPLTWLLRKVGRNAYNSVTLTSIDWILAASAKWNYRYHSFRNTFAEKSRPTAMFAVLQRAE